MEADPGVLSGWDLGFIQGRGAEEGLHPGEANVGEAEPSCKSRFQFKPGREQGEDAGGLCAVV